MFHLAAQADVRVSVDAGPRRRVNVIGTVHVSRRTAARARKSCSHRAAAPSTATVARRLPCNEPHPHNPGSPYAASKKAALDYFRVYRDLYGLDFTVLALGDVYGPRQDPHGEAGVVAIFSGRIVAGEPCTMNGDGDQTATTSTSTTWSMPSPGRPTPGRRRADEHRYRDRESVNMLYRRWRRPPASTAPPPRPVRRASSCAALDPGKAGDHLGWRPRTDLGDGAARTLAWFQQR